MNTTIMLFLLQDGITNGAIYALLGLALVLVFAVTRVILIPQGEFVTFGALSYAVLATGKVPGTAWAADAVIPTSNAATNPKPTSFTKPRSTFLMRYSPPDLSYTGFATAFNDFPTPTRPSCQGNDCDTQRCTCLGRLHANETLNAAYILKEHPRVTT